MSDFEFTVHHGALDDLLDSADTKELLQGIGDDIAARAAAKAPKLTGGGAESIQAVVSEDTDGPYVDVSWDSDHYYMRFAETGSEHQPATPFLRPALDETTL